MKYTFIHYLFLLTLSATAQVLDPHFPQAQQGSGVEVLAASGDILYVGGNFGLIGGKVRNNLAAIHIGTGEILDFAPTVNSTIRGMTLVQGKLAIWGDFTQINGVGRNNFGVVDALTGAVDPFNPVIIYPGIPGLQTGTMSDVQVAGDTLFLAGYFISVDGEPRPNLAAVTLDGTLLPWSPGTDIPVNRILVSGDFVYVAGPFYNPREGLLAFHRHTGALLPWNPQPNNPGNTYGPLIRVENSDDIMVAGPFSQLGTTPRPYLVRVNGLSGHPGNFNPGLTYGNPVSVMVNTLAQDVGLLYIGGQFHTSFGGIWRQNLVVLDPGSGVVSAWNPSPNTWVRAILHHEGAIFVGGHFTLISSTIRSFLAAYDTSVTSTDPVQEVAAVKLFPNPTQGQVALASPHLLHRVRLTDATGRFLRQWEQLPEGVTLLNLDALAAGRYYLECRSVKGLHTLPLEIVR